MHESRCPIIPFCLALTMLMIGVNSTNGEGGLSIMSPAFGHNQMIPRQFTCQGDDISPPLVVSGIPENTKSLALIIDDPDAPMGTWVHWVVYNIPCENELAEGTIPGEQGLNDFGKKNYGGPCPPTGIHRYFFKIYALDTILETVAGMTKQNLEKTMDGHVLGHAEWIGLYQKS